MTGRGTLLSIVAIALAGCNQQMAEQPHYHRPLAGSNFFSDGRASRPNVEGTVARGQLGDDAHFEMGKVDGEFVKTLPFELTETDLKRGRQRFEIYCAVCHDRVGTGRGIVVRRGYSEPPNFHADLSRGYKIRGRDLSLREVPVGYIFDVATHGFGSMPSLSAEVPTRDRWLIVAHVRVLQLSQNLKLDDLPRQERDKHFPAGDKR